MDSIEQLLMSMPKPTLSSERDRRIRDAILSAPSPTPPERVRWSFTMPRFAVAFASALVAVVAMSGYAYAAPTITRGDVLYTVKRGIEDVQRLLPRTPLERVQLHTTFALRRAGELEVLVGERGGSQRLAFVPIAYAAEDDAVPDGGDPVSATAADLMIETEAAVRVAETITETVSAQRAVQVLARGQERVQERLVRAAQRVGIANPRRAEVLARAMVTAQATAVASRAAAAETAVAAARGDTRVRIMVTPKREGSQAPVEAVALTEELSDERLEIPALRSSLADAGVPDADADIFIRQIETKLDRADAAIRSGKGREVRGELDAAAALRKHAKHFVKTVEHDAPQREEAEDLLAAAHATLDEFAGRVEILQDFQPEHRMVRAATALLETARAKLAEADASFAVGADARARTQAAVASELLDRLEDRLRGLEEAEEPEEQPDADAFPEDDDVQSLDRATDDVRFPTLEEDIPDDQPLPERGEDPMKDIGRPSKFDVPSGTMLERQKWEAERMMRKERVRAKVEEWGGVQGSTTATDPMTGVRYEFKGEYLRPLSW